MRDAIPDNRNNLAHHTSGSLRMGLSRPTTVTNTSQNPSFRSGPSPSSLTSLDATMAPHSTPSRTESDGKEHEVFPFPVCLARRSTDRPAQTRPECAQPGVRTTIPLFLPDPDCQGEAPQIIRLYLPLLPERRRLRFPRRKSTAFLPPSRRRSLTPAAVGFRGGR
jgi:hypothetical protein